MENVISKTFLKSKRLLVLVQIDFIKHGKLRILKLMTDIKSLSKVKILETQNFYGMEAEMKIGDQLLTQV